MKLIDNEMYKARMSVNDKININDMTEEAKEFYFAVYSLYMELMYKYLLKKTDIINYDNILTNKGYKFVSNGNQDFYQNFSDEFLRFFYIRNNLYMDRLTNEEIEFLGNKLSISNFELDKETENFIEKTYKKLIFENVSGNYDSNFEVNFGPNNPMFFAPVDALVIGVRYNEEFGENFIEEYLIKRDFIEKIRVEISEKLNKVLSVPVAVIYYNNDSIKKNNNLEDLHIK